MEYIIDNVYLEEAVNIRNEYFLNITKITTYENELLKYKNEIDKILKDLKSVKQTDINEKLIDLEVNINRIQNIIEPLKLKTEQLEKQADYLYESIITKYPNIQIDDIKKQIAEKL